MNRNDPDPATPPAESDERELEAPAGFLPLPRAALTVDLVAGAISFVSLMAGASAGLLVAVLLAPSPLVWILAGAWLALGALLAYLCFYYPYLSHRRLSYRADEQGLEIRRGVWWRSHLLVARARIQHTDVAQGPLQRRFGLARLVVHTAGTHNASTTLSGIRHDEALRIRELLTEEAFEARSPADGDGV